jgi:hypothetical protein
MLHQKLASDASLTCHQGKAVFIAAPMSGFDSNKDYEESRKIILDLIDHLKKQHTFSDIYYAGSQISSRSQFTSHNLAMKVDLDALRRSALFILLYPEKLISSVLVEAGYAMACRTPMLLMVKNRGDLPYFFREAEQISGDETLPPIEIQEYKGYRDLERSIDASIPRLLHKSCR